MIEEGRSTDGIRLDCSVTMAWVFPDEATDATDWLRDSLVEGRAFVPSLWPAEVGNVLLTATRRGRIRVDEWPEIRANLEALPIEIEPGDYIPGVGRVARTGADAPVVRLRRDVSGTRRDGCNYRWLRWTAHSVRPAHAAGLEPPAVK